MYLGETKLSYPAIEIILQPIGEKSRMLVRSNSMQMVRFLIKSIKQYLTDHPNSIFFFYADNAPIYMNSKRIKDKILPQDFRQKLFVKILTKDEDVIYETFAMDIENTNHRVTIFSRSDSLINLCNFSNLLKDYFFGEK